MRLITQYPFLLLLFGPPLLRTLSGRSAEASLQGSLDLWVLVQIGLWAGVGGWAFLRILLRERSLVLNDGIGQLYLFLALLLSASLFASILNSPGKTLSFVFSALHLSAVIATVDFAETLARSRSPDAAMKIVRMFRNIAMILLGLVCVFLVVNRNYVAIESPEFGLRVLGGSVAPVAITSLVAFISSTYLYIKKYDRSVYSVVFILVAVALLFLAKTRFVYFLFVLSAIYLWVVWLRSSGRRKSLGLSVSASLMFVALIVPFILIQSEQLIGILSRGSLETLKTGSGRTLIIEWAVSRIVESPLGIGFVAGFRSEFLALADLGNLAGSPLIASRIGNTHNSFVEILIGAGWHALAFYVLVISIAASGLLKKIPGANTDPALNDLEQARTVTLILFVSLVMLNMPNADFAIPGRAAFAYIWFSFAMSLGIHLRLKMLRRLRWQTHDPSARHHRPV